MGETRLDDLARDLASGAISRRTALRRLAAGALGIGLAAAPSVLADELERGTCPPRRRCGRRCCPRGAECRGGRCKCLNGKRKCGNRCVNLQTSEQHCGACNIVCAAGETCVAGACVAPELCGNGVIDGAEECDGNDLGGETCVSLGFAGGTLACAANCTHDTSGCTNLEGCGSRECGQAPNGEDCGTCSAGEVCTDSQCIPEDLCAGVTCQPLNECYESGVCNPETGICSNPVRADGSACTGGTCQGGTCLATGTETCNGIDDNGDGQIDEGYGVGEPCECAGGAQGVTVCSADGLSIVCAC